MLYYLILLLIYGLLLVRWLLCIIRHLLEMEMEVIGIGIN
jgi:hypothetical protein